MGVTRRRFLWATGGVAVWLGTGPRGFCGLAAAQGAAPGPAVPTAPGRTLVVCFLRGGVDGLNFVIPHGDPGYRARRPTLAIPAPGQPGGALDLDGFFGLHPALAPLQPRFAEGQGIAVHAVGSPGNTRSHFEEQDAWETGVTRDTLRMDGWLNRHLAQTAPAGDATGLRAIAIGDALPRMLRGPVRTYALRGLEDLAVGGGSERERIAAALAAAYGAGAADRSPAGDLLAETGQATLQGLARLREVVATPYVPAAPYPEGDLGRRLREIARLVKAGVGLEVATVDVGGWDTHQNQGIGAEGPYAQLVGGLAGAVAAFLADLGPHAAEVCLVTLSEFGRTVAENGTRGTDHGWGGVVCAFGGPVARARAAGAKPVLGTWPGLAADALKDGRDLAHTTDFRDVLAELLRVHLGNPRTDAVFPGHVARPVGLLA